MDGQEQRRFENLHGACVEEEFLRETHGIHWPADEQFRHDFTKWQSTLRAEACPERKLDRYKFEMFLQSQALMTRNYAAAALGMQPASLDQLLEKLSEIGLSKKYAVYNGVIDKSLSEDLIRSLAGLRFRTFGNHSSFCKLLHAALNDALRITIEALFCATADQLGEERLYASTWDNITLKPLSVKHSVWLDFQKPVALAPDRCSKLFYAQHQEELRAYLAGREEPRDLADYDKFMPRSA